MAKLKTAAIDIGTNSIKTISLSKRKNRYYIDNIGISFLPVGVIDKSDPLKNVSNFKDTLKHLFNQAKLNRNKNIIFSLSGDFIVIRYITLPHMPREDLQQAAINEAEQYIPFNIKDVVISADIACDEPNKESDQMDVILVAGKKSVIESYLTIFEQLKINVISVDTDITSLINLFTETKPYEESDDTTVLLNIGASISNLILFNKSKPVFSRDINIGGDNITKIISNDMGCSLLEAEKLKKKYSEIIPDTIKKHLGTFKEKPKGILLKNKPAVIPSRRNIPSKKTPAPPPVLKKTDSIKPAIIPPKQSQPSELKPKPIISEKKTIKLITPTEIKKEKPLIKPDEEKKDDMIVAKPILNLKNQKPDTLITPPPPPSKIDGEYSGLVNAKKDKEDTSKKTEVQKIIKPIIKDEKKNIKQEQPEPEQNSDDLDFLGGIGKIKKPPPIKGGSQELDDILKEDNTGDEIKESISIVLNLLLPQFLNDISRSLNYYESQHKGKKITKIFITGGGSAIKGLDKFISSRLGVPAIKLELLNYFELDTDDKIIYENINSFSVALGMALRILNSKK